MDSGTGCGWNDGAGLVEFGNGPTRSVQAGRYDGGATILRITTTRLTTRTVADTTAVTMAVTTAYGMAVGVGVAYDEPVYAEPVYVARPMSRRRMSSRSTSRSQV